MNTIIAILLLVACVGNIYYELRHTTLSFEKIMFLCISTIVILLAAYSFTL